MSWQEKLDGLFPSGLKVVQIDDVLEGVGQDFDDSVSFLTPQITVLEETEDGGAMVQIFVYEFFKDVIFTITSLEELSEGTYVAHTPDSDKDYLLTSNLPKAVLAQLQKAKEGNDE